MKKFIITSILLAMFTAGATLMAQEQPEEYLGLPGDNLNLYAVMKLFQESKTLEEFEKNLNDENSRINNLDLNGDNMVDYIRVTDDIDGDVHNIVLQVAVNGKETQDVAVFTVQRESNGQVFIQLTGDEELYGRNYIIEPIYDEAGTGQTPNPGYTGNIRTVNGQNVTVTRTTTVEIAAWPLVRFIYMPTYVIWHSSWYWGYYPSYWHPWQPFYWHYYYGYHYNWHHDYYGHYHRWDHHRYSHWNDFYYNGRRSHSPDVGARIQSGHFKETYSRPEQRKEGEAMYAKMNQGANRRSSDNSLNNSSVNNSERRTNSRSATDRKSTGTVKTTTRRSSTTVTNKSDSKAPVEHNTGTTRRSSTTVTKKAVTNPPAGTSTGTTRRSTTTVTNKSVANPSSGQKANTTRVTRQSKSTGVSSTTRRSSKSSATPKNSERTKAADGKKDSRRK
jgi:hypothetical protein